MFRTRTDDRQHSRNTLSASATERAEPVMLPRYAIALLATALAVCVGLLLEPVIDDGGPWLTPTLVFVIAVMIAARYGGKKPGLLAIAVSVLADAFFFLPPFHSLNVTSLTGLVQVALFVLIGLLVTGVLETLRATRFRAETSALLERESEERFRRLVEGVQDYALLLLDEQGRIVSWNPGVERVLGWREEEIVGQPIACVFTPEDVTDGVPEQELERAARENRASDDRWHRRKDGTLFFATGVTEALRDKVGNVRGFSKVMRDETERRRMEYIQQGQAAALDRLVSNLTTRSELQNLLALVLSTVTELMTAQQTCLWLRSSESAFDRHCTFNVDGSVLDMKEGGKAIWDLIAREEELWDEMVHNREPIVIEDAGSDARVRHSDWLVKGGGTVILAPLLLGEETVGVLGIAGSAARRYRPEEIELAQALAQQAGLAVQLGRLAEQEQKNAVLQERNRMASEIHDTLAQGFTGIALQLEAAEFEVTRAPDKALTRLCRARDLARQSLQEARRSVWALQPEALLHENLPSVLRTRVEQMLQGTSVEAKLRTEGDICPLPPDVETHLLRIGLEAVTNTLKHANARFVQINLTYEPHHVRLVICDDGKGFSADSPPGQASGSDQSTAYSGFGLKAMRERANRIGAELTISSNPGAGTKISVTTPVVAAGGSQ